MVIRPAPVGSEFSVLLRVLRPTFCILVSLRLALAVTTTGQADDPSAPDGRDTIQ